MIVIDEILKEFGSANVAENCRKQHGAAGSGIAAALKRVPHERCVFDVLVDRVGGGELGVGRGLDEARSS